MAAGETLNGLLAHGSPDSVAIAIPNGPELTYRRLRQVVEQTAHRLTELGLRRGDTIAFVLPNSVETVVLFLDRKSVV